MRFFFALLTVLISAAISTHTLDAAPVWNMHASSCRADNTAIQGNWYVATDGGVGHRGTTTSTITMYCPVLTVGQDPFVGGGSTIAFIGVSGHPAQTGPSITAQLVRMSKNTGALSNVGSSVTLTFISPGLILRKTGRLTHQFDFTQYFYYVRIDISRTNSGQNVSFYVVDLSTSP
jgi:hypothetical protein